jgi:hypothetical protein
MDDFMTHQGPTAPVLGDVTEHAVFDPQLTACWGRLVPFAGPWRKVTHLNRYPQLHGQVMQGKLPQAASTAVAAPAIGRDQQLFGAASCSPATQEEKLAAAGLFGYDRQKREQGCRPPAPTRSE